MDQNSIQTRLSEIGNRIAELRKMKGYSDHKDFALDNGLPTVLYWKVENGKTNFTIKTLLKILSIHDVSLEQFFIRDIGLNEPMKVNDKVA